MRPGRKLDGAGSSSSDVSSAIASVYVAVVPLPFGFRQHRADQRMMAMGKMLMTSARWLTSLLKRSRGFGE